MSGVQDFFAVLDSMLNANSQNSRKSQPVIEWFQDIFDAAVRAAVVNDKKQSYNRVPEQFKYKDETVIFVVVDSEALRPLKNTAINRWYPELKSVLLLQADGAGNYPEGELLLAEKTTVSDFFEQNLSGLTVEQITPEMTATHENPKAIASTLNPSWDKEIPNELSELVGLKKPLTLALSALRAGKHVIFVGPPGTGKTQVALALGELTGVETDICTATSEWSTFETIGGYFPTGKSDDGETPRIDFLPGVVTKSIEKSHWLLIDELNRADVDKAFGELFTLLSGANVRLPFCKLDGSVYKDIELVHEGKEVDESSFVITVPKNWRILATINSYDKASLYQLSYAFMRRFSFVEIPVPDEKDYKDILDKTSRRVFKEDLEGFRTTVLSYISKLFSEKGEGSLSSTGVSVGPAVAIDALATVAELIKLQDRSGDHTVLVRNSVTEALGATLFPQFEGRDREHQGIIEALFETLETPSEERETLDRKLRSWTGAEQ